MPVGLRWNREWGIFSRSTAGYLIVLFLLAASNIYAIVKLDQFNTIILGSHNLDMRLLDVEKKLADALFSQRRYEQKYLLTKDEVLYNQFLASKDDFGRYLAEMESVAVSASKKEILEKIRLYQKRYQALVDAGVKSLRDGNYNKNRFKAEKERAADAILEELDKLQNYSREDVGYKTKMVGDVGAVARKVAVTSFLITILLAIALSFFITRSITNPLIKLVNKTREIPTGSFNCDFDVSAPPEIRELAEAFNLMCERLKEVDTMKSEFFSMISHELRTPLTTIKEGTSLLMEGVGGGTMTQKQGKLLGIIAAESGRLAGLVNSILDLSKMEAGMMRYTFAPVSIPHLVEQAVTEIAPYAEAKRITVQTQVDAKVPSCRMDGERILEVLRNLIGNAVKFTPEGGRITVAAKPLDGGVEVSVSDTGPGIPWGKLATIFEKYHSSDQKMGTGLGLAIAKHIVAAHGGRLWAESKPGAGSRFVFVLPA